MARRSRSRSTYHQDPPAAGAADRLDHLTNELLAVRAQAGDQEAFSELVRRFEGRLFNFLRRRCATDEDAAECTQNTLVLAWQGIGRYSPRWRFSTWVYTIAVRQSIQLLRDRSARPSESGESIFSDLMSPQDAPDRKHEREELRRNVWQVARERLTEEQRTILWLRFVEDYAVQDVARIIGRTPVTTRVLLFRARQALRRHLEAIEGASMRPSHGRAVIEPLPAGAALAAE
ncbi:MAG: sigma-70 family RNA polymerase sigma factor [Phycisphaeraceae bacterium]|nr:sigma-70 family RNA polymerase sigma factor [Phycisphaerales bacterium]QOJ16715.1 MAG: sigma-70 family RNA polymerase sigma factor [Phycisphaeraceae bacterium]